MNLLPATTAASASGLTLDWAPGIGLPLASSTRLGAARCTVGVRPEHLRLDANGVPATVQVVEPTGSETQVLMKVGNQSMVGAFRERVSAKPGEILPVRPDPALVHLFDQQSGQRL